MIKHCIQLHPDEVKTFEEIVIPNVEHITNFTWRKIPPESPVHYVDFEIITADPMTFFHLGYDHARATTSDEH